MENIISIQPCPDGFVKKYKGDNGNDFEEKVLFLIFTKDETFKDGNTIGPNIHAVCAQDICEGYFVIKTEVNCLGVFNVSENDSSATSP